MKLLLLFVIVICQFLDSTRANINSSETTIKSVTNGSVEINLNKSEHVNSVVVNVDTESDQEETSSPDLFGRRFVNFLSRRQSRVKESRSESIKSKYIRLAQSIKDTTDDLLSTFLPIVLRSLSDIELSDTCSGQVFRVIQGLYHQQTWAFKRELI